MVGGDEEAGCPQVGHVPTAKARAKGGRVLKNQREGSLRPCLRARLDLSLCLCCLLLNLDSVDAQSERPPPRSHSAC